MRGMELDLQKPSLSFLLGLGITTVYIPGIIGASIPTGWFFLFIVAALVSWFCKFETGLGFIFICFAALSLLWTESVNIGFFFLLKLIALGVTVCLGMQLRDLRPLFKGLAVGLGVSDIIALFQFYGYKGIFVANGVTAGLFVNPNIFCEVSVIILIALMVMRLYWWIPVTLPGIVLVHSRGALLALVACSLIFLWKRDKFYFTVLLLLSICVALAYDVNNILSVQERLNLWADTIRGFSLFGNGVGSFEILYPLYAINIDTTIARPRYAHNDLLQFIFEYGIAVILLVPLIWKALTSDNEYKIILYAVGIISLFTYPFNVPVPAFIGCILAGYLIGYDTNRNIGDSGRPILSKSSKRKS